MTARDLVARVEGLVGADLSALGEQVRSRAEELARRDPSRLPPFVGSLRRAADRNREFLPWALWAEGTAEQLRGRPARAEPLLRQGAASFRRRHQPWLAARVDIARTDALACLGRLEAANRCGRRAFSTFASAGDRHRAAAALINLAGVADARDQVRTAIRLWHRARRMLAPEDELRRAVIDGSLAGGWQALGLLGRSERTYRDVIPRLEQAGAIAAAAQMRLGLAELAGLAGDAAVALEQAVHARQDADRCQDENLRLEAELLMARLELELAHPERAAAIAEQSIPVAEEAGRLDDAGRLAAIRAIAVAAGAEGDPKAARERAEQRLAAAGLRVQAAVMRTELARFDEVLDAAALRQDIATMARAGLKTQADRGRLALAQAALDAGCDHEARRQAHTVLAGGGQPVAPRLEAHVLAAEASWSQDRPAAIIHLRRAVALAESVRGRLPADRDRTAFVERLSGAYERLVEGLLDRGDSRSRRQAFDLVARLKSRTLLEAIDRRSAHEWTDAPEMVQRWATLRRELGALLAAVDGRNGGSSRYLPSAVGERVRRLTRRLDDLELEIARASPALGAACGRVAVPALRDLLAPGELYLEVFLTRSDLIVFALDRTGLRVTVHADVRRELERRIEAVRFHLSKAIYGRRHIEAASDVLTAQVDPHLAWLGEILLAPLDACRGPVTTLYFAPHGPLHHLPVAALSLDGRALIERCSVAVTPGAGVLARILAASARAPQSLGVAGAAGCRLTEVDREVAEVATTMPRAAVVANAGAAEVLDLLGRCDAVHVAAHGAFQPTLPAGSGLRLGDGWLTAFDLVRSPIRARLVTLGACETGEVAVAPGEEVAGVLRALLESGVHTAVLAVGWLDDRVAREVARGFWEQVGALGPGEALRRVQLELRRELRHPALWAGPQLFGNPRPWESAP